MGLVDAAVQSVHVAMFKIDLVGVRGSGVVAQLLDGLRRAAGRGVETKVLMDCILPLRGRAANNAGVGRWLQGKGIPVRYLSRNRCEHAKLVLVDEKHFVFGSHNWTTNSLTRNFEVSCYLTDSEIVEGIEKVFREQFDRAVDFVNLGTGEGKEG